MLTFKDNQARAVAGWLERLTGMTTFPPSMYSTSSIPPLDLLRYRGSHIGDLGYTGGGFSMFSSPVFHHIK